uniref:DDB1 and CUL4 associated factor 11 n=1 Tax=Pipistrellus kuhlii TaxID=59472 RepID=A0A7J8AYU0_PIPKU|nr:DDB1 and CUL4 associated factor 11 [Pipistrellus kuhlii]
MGSRNSSSAGSGSGDSSEGLPRRGAGLRRSEEEEEEDEDVDLAQVLAYLLRRPSRTLRKSMTAPGMGVLETDTTHLWTQPLTPGSWNAMRSRRKWNWLQGGWGLGGQPGSTVSLKCCIRENGASATGEASPLENSLE